MADIGPVNPPLLPDESLIWEGKPPNQAMREEYVLLVNLMAVVLILLNLLLGAALYGNLMNESGSPLTFILLLALFDPFLIFFVTVLRRERFFGELSYRITTQRAYIFSPNTISQKVILLHNFNLSSDWTRGDGDYYYLPLEKIRLVIIRANTGIRQYFGLKNFDIFLSASSHFEFKRTVQFAQVTGIPTVVNALVRKLGFSRVDPILSTTGMECYSREI